MHLFVVTDVVRASRVNWFKKINLCQQSVLVFNLLWLSHYAEEEEKKSCDPMRHYYIKTKAIKANWQRWRGKNIAKEKKTFLLAATKKMRKEGGKNCKHIETTSNNDKSFIVFRYVHDFKGRLLFINLSL